ncbi:MAG: protein rep [Flavobacteriales bacterium]|nr:protein rep [Flavobacteriales bacterium]
MLTQKICLKLIDVSEAKQNERSKKSFWNTYHCQNKLVKANGRIYGDFCKNRFCTLCSSIRKAAIINTYLTEILDWDNPYFVTLTCKSCPAKSLKNRVTQMLRGFRIILDRNKKRNQRGTGIKLVGLKALECNFNPIRKTYNPHFHIIVANKEMADLLVEQWCSLLTSKFATKAAQNATEIWDKEKALIEIVKYSSKIFTDPEMKKRGKSGQNPQVYAAALHNIIEAFRGHRVFDRFGFNTSKKSTKEPKYIELSDYENLTYSMEDFDWVFSGNDKKLTNYMPAAKTLDILSNNIDTFNE